MFVKKKKNERVEIKEKKKTFSRGSLIFVCDCVCFYDHRPPLVPVFGSSGVRNSQQRNTTHLTHAPVRPLDESPQR